ncbi:MULTISPECIES: JAB domain-containing protein [Flavobacteriaceae]|uniref:JAB domain-containing protein n=1 Tax=Flavobacteriaceae TaxID=49546 RepID=UPI003A8FE101
MASLFEIKEIEIFYKSDTLKADRNKITSSVDAYAIFLKSYVSKIEYQEVFSVMLLNNSNDVLGIKTISTGSITGTLVDIRLIFQTALKAHATGLILCHNHPSGNLKPSQADKDLTAKIKKGAQFLDIKLLDHLIITSENYTSFADDNIL